MTVSSNVTRHSSLVDVSRRAGQYGQKPGVVWLTGLSGSGKSTIAMEVERQLVESGRFAFVLDGDNLRHGLCGDLGFSPDDRRENIRRVGEVARLFYDAGAIVLCAFVSPSTTDRERIRSAYPEVGFMEVHVSTPLSVCEERDPKQLYARARRGEITDFTGVSAPYETPANPDIFLDTSLYSVRESAALVLKEISIRWLTPQP